ncbi:hypothetical protein LY78DRAFT_85594 [Colletotrichum sublineola]|nr:hypothetical protein LY78DRAFT_85594 [Colletotrichum sublineola]
MPVSQNHWTYARHAIFFFLLFSYTPSFPFSLVSLPLERGFPCRMSYTTRSPYHVQGRPCCPNPKCWDKASKIRRGSIAGCSHSCPSIRTHAKIQTNGPAYKVILVYPWPDEPNFRADGQGGTAASNKSSMGHGETIITIIRPTTARERHQHSLAEKAKGKSEKGTDWHAAR